MWTYWAMLLLPALAALQTNAYRGFAQVQSQRTDRFVWFHVWLGLSILIGYRFEVGGDWNNYLKHLVKVSGQPFWEALMTGDPCFQLLTWLSIEMDWGIFGVNLASGAIFAFGLVRFCRNQSGPWLALAVAVPYLVIVVGMGYTRQSVALGLTMLGLSAIRRGNLRGFIIWVVLAATFHKSSVVLLPIAAMVSTRDRLWTAVWVGLTAIVLFTLLLSNDAEDLYKNYVEAEQQSEGAMVRLLMNALPAVIFLRWRRRFQFGESEARLWTYFSVITLILLMLLLVATASTAIDRIALYMLPLQIVVFSQLPNAYISINRRNASRNSGYMRPNDRHVVSHGSELITIAILCYYGVVQFVWLNYAVNAGSWIPYRMYIFD